MGYEIARDSRMRKEGIVFVPTLLHPRSRGEIRLRNTDPLSQPAIHPHYLKDADDVKQLSEVKRRETLRDKNTQMTKNNNQCLCSVLFFILALSLGQSNLTLKARSFDFNHTQLFIMFIIIKDQIPISETYLENN